MSIVSVDGFEQGDAPKDMRLTNEQTKPLPVHPWQPLLPEGVCWTNGGPVRQTGPGFHFVGGKDHLTIVDVVLMYEYVRWLDLHAKMRAT